MSDDLATSNDDRATATLRIPAVRGTAAGAVVLELVPADAAVLARILIHYGQLVATQAATAADASETGYDADTWNQAAHRLFTERAAVELRPEAVLVPFLRGEYHDYLREVGPDEEGPRP